MGYNKRHFYALILLIGMVHTMRGMSTKHNRTRSNSIEILKRLLAHRQMNTKYPRINKSVTQIKSMNINISYSLITQTNFLLLSSTKRSSHPTNLILVLICCLIGFVFFIIIFRQYFHRSYRKFSSPNLSPIETRSKEIFSDQLLDIYLDKHAFDDLGFTNEFKNLPNHEDLSCISATRSIVSSKNRFLNILPIDETRVILNEINNDPASDYINGNYISGYQCPKKFIATQGPKADTCEDFWRMIWELELQSIVMLTNITEGALRMTKCHQYWPDLYQTIIYGSYQIICIDERNYSAYKKRCFQISQINNDDKDISPSSSLTTNETLSLNSLENNHHNIRLIVQYHFTQWKDMDVPNDSYRLIQLIHDVNQQTNIQQYPIVVHCTAGVGRTGTYIAIDAMIEKLKREGQIDIFNFVSQMRRERHLMVQTVKQYAYIYRSVLEYYFFGNTRIEGQFYQSIYFDLKKNLLMEYNKLEFLPRENLSHHDAFLPENLDKNRNQQIIPFDHNRVCLSRILGHPYINASFIDETRFIITQDPLDETIVEFWRMFIEHNTNCIVQLHNSSSNCPIYYPTETNPILKLTSTSLIKFLSKEIFHEKFILRQFYLTDTRQTITKTIYHYEYLPLIKQNLTEYYLFDFIGQINKNFEVNSLITIHCENGGSTCTIFVLMMILLDQLKTEHVVDIFQTVRELQQQRLGMRISFNQYEYLYEMLLKFLDESYDLTSRKSSISFNNSIYDNDP